MLRNLSSKDSNAVSHIDDKASRYLIQKIQRKLAKMRRARSRQRLSFVELAPAMKENEIRRSDSHVTQRRQSNTPEGPECLLSLLSDDLMLQVSSFLSCESVDLWRQTNRASRLVLSDPYIWRNYIESQWPFLGDCLNKIIVSQLEGNISKETNPSELAMMLKLACQQQSTGIDESTLVHAPPKATRPVIVNGSISSRRIISSQDGPVLQTRALTDGSKAIQYTGPIGHGDRSVRANYPLARPTERLHSRRALLCRRFSLRATIRRTLSLPEECNWRPFTSPFMQSDGSINLTPRLVSYFEVSIMAEAANNDEEAGSNIDASLQEGAASSDECVAVGLAGCRFYCTTRMPGWDALSYGYHGDDGGFFHGSGSMRQQYGPRFGQGDVVGCGVDYCNNTIFFTLNGRSLGTAMEQVFDGDAEHVGLYPVVGVDSSSLVRCNFVGPFQFDLAGYMQKQMHAVQAAIVQKKALE
ncbi:hypothetical protein MPSEU_000850000 [Mayamaea pseudoterrestris]|nr:hypothetical protein MPSEU_000850000 [Mayamaea pseudoterrestris]